MNSFKKWSVTLLVWLGTTFGLAILFGVMVGAYYMLAVESNSVVTAMMIERTVMRWQILLDVICNGCGVIMAIKYWSRKSIIKENHPIVGRIPKLAL